MEQRKITDAEIDATLPKPDGRYRDPREQVMFFRMIDGRIIHVCIWKDRKPMTTRTARRCCGRAGTSRAGASEAGGSGISGGSVVVISPALPNISRSETTCGGAAALSVPLSLAAGAAGACDRIA